MDAKTTALFGGVKMEVAFRDGTAAEVTVQQLPIRKMEAYLEAQKSETDMIELVTGLKPEAVDNLTIESHEALVEAIEKVNADFFSRWLTRLKARVEKLAPGLMAEKLKGPSLSPIGSPSAASKPA